MYVRGLIDVVPVQRRRVAENSRISNSLLFFLRVSGQRRRVCKSMFLFTLGIGEWSALNWAKEGHTQADTKGQTHSNACRSVAGHEFILQNLPKVPSHYCRSTTSKQYLEPVFQSMADLYAVYCRAAAEKNVTPLSRPVFTDEFKHLNLGLYHPPATFLMTSGSTTSFEKKRPAPKSCPTKARPATTSWSYVWTYKPS